ncbi:hypothetical protein GY45DRAFT_1229111, partial [Cubamyces sp. BRFM 1775]
SVACYRLMVCPTHTLEIGTPVSIRLLLGHLDDLSHVPAVAVGTYHALRTGFEGMIVGIRSQTAHEVEFVVRNEDRSGALRRAYVTAPRLRG